MTVVTVAQVQSVLAEEGFGEQLIAEGPQLRVVSSGVGYLPEDLVVARLMRLQGITTSEEEALVFALTTRDGEPLGTYAPPALPAMPAADAAIVEQLHADAIPEDEIRSHTRHDHIAAVFDDRQAAQTAVDELAEWPGQRPLGSRRA